jgi:hypothetical protein
MSSDSDAARSEPEPEPTATYVYDMTNRLRRVYEDDGDRGILVTSYRFPPGSKPRSFTFAHDKQKRLFNLTCSSGAIEHFRDNPTRQLAVEPDPVTGEMRPVMRDGEPVYVYLCREEREA